MADYLGLGFHDQRSADGGAVDPDAGCCRNREHEVVAVARRAVGISGTYKPGAHKRPAVHNSLCSLCKSSSGTQMVAWIVAGVSAICGHYRAVADSKWSSLRAFCFLAQQLLV